MPMDGTIKAMSLAAMDTNAKLSEEEAINEVVRVSIILNGNPQPNYTVSKPARSKTGYITFTPELAVRAGDLLNFSFDGKLTNKVVTVIISLSS
jgi:hypothetical protein